MAREMIDSGIAWIGTIPKEWDTVKFKYLHNGLNTGESIDKDFWTTEESETVFYTAGLTPIRTSYKEFPIWKYTRSNDILLARNGTPYVYFPVEQACYSDHIIRAAMKDGINRRFVQYSLQQSIASVVVDTVSIATWSASLWNEQTIPWPSEIEQKRIVTYLDTECARIDAVMEQTRASIEEYKKKKQAVITQAVTKGIRHNRTLKDSGNQWIGSIPQEWDNVISRFVIDQIGDVDHYMPASVDNGIPYVMTGDLKEQISKIVFCNCKQISNEDYLALSKKVKPEMGDVIFARYATIGTVCYVDMNIDCIISYSCVVIKPIRSILCGKYLYYYLKSQSFLEDVKQYTNSNTQGNVGIEALYRVKIPIPGLEEQNEIAKYLDAKSKEIDLLIEKKERFLEDLGAYKKTLIYEYVTGKKEVKT